MAAEVPFVGRENELAELEAMLRGVEEDGAGLSLLTGEPGIGKSALCGRFAARARRRGIPVAWGRTWEWGGAPPYWSWVQVLRQLDGSRTPDTPGSPVSLELEGRAGARTGERDDRARFLLFDGVAARLRRATQGGPLLVVLEDLHAADDPSLLLLRFLVESLEDAPVLLVGTWRSAEPTASPQAASLMRELECVARTLELEGLTSDEIATRLVDPAHAAEMHRRTGGNPLFIAALVEAGNALEPESRPPSRARAAVERRVAWLGAQDREVLSAAAVLGQEVAVRVLARVCGRPLDAVLAHVRVLLEEHILVERPDAPGRYEFRHGLFQEVVYAALPPADRLRLHRAAGSALEELYGAERHLHLAELSRHFLAVTPDPERGVEYAVGAAEAAMRLLAFEEASEYLRRALSARDGDPSDTVQTSSLWVRLAEAQAAAGGIDKARGSLARAREAAVQSDSTSLLADVAIARARIAGFGRRDDEAVQWLEEVLERRDVDAACRLRLLGALVDRTWPYPRSETRVLTLSRRTLELSVQVGDPRLRADALARTLFTLWSTDAERFAEHRERARELMRIAEHVQDPELRVEGLRWWFTICMIEGAVEEAKQTLDEYERLAERSGRSQLRLNALLRRFMLAVMEGRRADAQRLFAETQQAAVHAGDPQTKMLLMACRVALQELLGDRAALEAGIRELDRVVALDLPQAAGHAIRASLQSAVGWRDEAERSLARYFEQAPSCMAYGGPVAWVQASWAIWRLEDTAGAKRLMPWLQPYRDRMLMSGAIGFHGPGSLYLGMLAATTGRSREASAWLEHAIELLDGVGARVLAAQARRVQASVLAETDPERAARLEREVVEMADALGVAWLVEPRGTLPVTPPRGRETRRRAGGQLIVEGDYVTLALDDELVRVRRSKGLDLIERLLRHEGHELHVLALEGAALDDRGRGEPMLDATAKAEYRARVEELQAVLQEADRCADSARALRARAELEFLRSELSRAVGLGGRDRAHGVAERARARVTLAIRRAIKSLARSHPALAAHFATAISTGTFCSYCPEPRARIEWKLESPGSFVTPNVTSSGSGPTTSRPQ